MVSQWLLIESARHQIAIAGRITNAQTNKAISGVEVMLTKAPESFSNWLKLKALQYGERWQKMTQRPDRTRTAVDGHFHFLDLPNGEYSLTASLPTAGKRYGTAQVTVTVSRKNENKIVMAAADIALSPTIVKGKISDQNGDPVVLAQVRVNKSAERTFSNQQGQYLLMELEASQTQERIIIVSAAGYDIASGKVLLNEAGIEKTLDFVLKKRNSV
ncbi:MULTISPECIES: carboxypeptidase-like regulatory domain-containing protein [unclassified Nostoc]|uniref:carboxypeptidase-like regulatory domain-containing protein n=1 Tax=unclassified Nostoc TaxID=2593658 RepID=UPI002AD3A310|nr:MULTISPECIES: carboxypeptidase-like regulatory domain-containing protein [unclassified Nostoc]MDZ8124248.1 carboxypeptidase-like regulatory domain-containing protein [Nostoc sp. CmiVER01]MDZ8228177.1 carboxypeptidase-like regulatory domain-containing protein [Nostoc sp. ChiVER01]